MTLLGKILVFFNLAFSLLLASWAFLVYSNDIEAPKRNAEKEKQLTELWKGVAPAQANWQAGRRKVQDEESHLAADRVWYDNEMNKLFTAKAGNNIGAIFIAAADGPGVRKGQVVLDQGFPKLEPLKDRTGKPLQSLAVYNTQDNGILQSLQEAMDKQQKQIQEAIQLTDRIIGDDKKGIRGLQQRILDEKAKDADVLDEQKQLAPLLVGAAVDTQLIAKRREQMERRIKELKTSGVASGKK